MTSRLLLVDDERLILATVGACLEDAGHEVVAVQTAGEALREVQARPFDLALLDIRLARDSGLRLAEQIGGPDGPGLLFLSAFSDEDTVREANRLGGLGFLVKPAAPAQLVAAVEAALARHAERRAMRETGDQLSRALDQGREVSVAAGILMERFRLTREEAQARLRDEARASRARAQDVAARLIEACEALAASRWTGGRD
jgi:response regulator NasT